MPFDCPETLGEGRVNSEWIAFPPSFLYKPFVCVCWFSPSALPLWWFTGGSTYNFKGLHRPFDRKCYLR